MTTNPQALAIGAALTLLLTASPALAQTHGAQPRTSAEHAPPHAAPHAGPHAGRTPAEASHATPRHAEVAHADDPDGVVNIQTASAEQLQLLPGIGPSKADAIIRFRDTHPFHRVEDILRVRGIGRATFRRLRPMITVSGTTTMTTDVRAPRGAAPADASHVGTPPPE